MPSYRRHFGINSNLKKYILKKELNSAISIKASKRKSSYKIYNNEHY